MKLWCENCETFTTVCDLQMKCLDCGTDLIQEKDSGHRACHICDIFEPMAEADICTLCYEDMKACWNYTDLLETYPDLCAECFLRVAELTTCMCAPCYAQVCWDAPAGGYTGYDSEKLKSYYPSTGYDWWGEAEVEVIIPAAADELQSIPAMRAA